MTLKYTTGAPYFIETGHLEPAPVSSETFEKVRKTVCHALDTLQVRNSASHSEIKIDGQGNIRIIEIGSRMGGDAIGSDLVYYSTGIDFVRCVIDVACGKAPDLTPKREGCRAEVRFIMTMDDLEEFNRIKRENPESILRIVDEVHPEAIGKATDSSNRAGCYIIRVL